MKHSLRKMISANVYFSLAFALVLGTCCCTVAGHAQNEEHATQTPSDLVTQTVYGFLDFTTTIGNTVMVFSPQSAPPPEAAKAAPSSEAPVPSISVIETKPPSSATTYKPEINPTKPIAKATKQLSSVVRVVSVNAPVQNTPKSSKVQIVSSHVEVIDDSQKSAPKSVVHVEAIDGSNSNPREHSIILSSSVKAFNGSPPTESSVVEIHTSEDLDQFVPVENNINDPEYEFLSREPSEFAEETYRLPPNKIPNSKFQLKSRVIVEPSNKKLNPSQTATPRIDDIHPTGLVTKLGGTVVKDGITTIHETSVLGTFISGKYAQVLQSTSHIYNGNANGNGNGGNKPKIAPTHSLRVLKTAAPHIAKKTHVVESTSTVSQPIESEEIEELNSSGQKQSLVRNSRRPAVSSNSFKNRFRSNRPSSSALKEDNEYVDISSSASIESTTPAAAVTPAYKKPRNLNKAQKSGRFNRPSSGSVEVTTVSTVSAVFSEPSTSTAYVNRRNKANRFKPQNTQSKESIVQQQQQQQQQQLQQQQQQQASNDGGYTRRFKPKITPSTTDQQDSTTSSFYKFKLNRQPGRWQYKTSPKPRVTIRKQSGDDLQPHVEAVTPIHETPVYQSDESQQGEGQANDNAPEIVAASSINSRSDETDLDSSGSVNGDVLNDAETLDNAIVSKKLPIETLKVEISTPFDFKDTYYEIATIKSPYTYQVGSVKNTRYVTVTSTFEKTLDPEPTATTTLSGPLTENILATTAHYDRDNNLLDSSIATLPPLILASDVETPPLETLTETFSTTQTMLKTHILPVLREGGGNATSYTLTQTYMITRLVTATKTLPPMDAYHFNPSKALKEFNSKLDEAGSELNLELDFGDDNENEDDDSSHIELPDDLNLANIGSSFDLSEVDKSNIPEGHLRPKKKIVHKVSQSDENTTILEKHPQFQQISLQATPALDPIMQTLSPDQLQQLALLRLLNPAAAAQLPQIITTSKPIIKLETVYESHTIPIFNGISTTFSTISRPVATVSRTEYEIGTSALPQLPIPPPPPINPLFQQPQQFQITTAPIVTQTMITETKSKILKLTFGAKTAYTTLFSTNIVPTILTTYVTQSVPIIQPTAAFPGYFPAPYAQYPYVG